MVPDEEIGDVPGKPCVVYSPCRKTTLPEFADQCKEDICVGILHDDGITFVHDWVMK